MTVSLSKTQIDRLGERLRDGSLTEADLRLLDKYRQSFGEAYQTVFTVLSQVPRQYSLGYEEPTGREAKSTGSIIEKLRRESIRLTQMQDIAGCRVVVPNVLAQDSLVSLLVEPRSKQPSPPPLYDSGTCSDSKSGDEGVVEELRPPFFPEATVFDRRAKPSHGYRAVHVIVKIAGRPVEIQIRSRLQQLWAELSEKFSDEFDPSIKYGGGDEWVQGSLSLMSQIMGLIERNEIQISKIQKLFDGSRVLMRFAGISPENVEEKLKQAWQDTEYIKEKIAIVIEETVNIVSERSQPKHSMVIEAVEHSLNNLSKFLSSIKMIGINLDKLLDRYSDMLSKLKKKISEE